MRARGVGIINRIHKLKIAVQQRLSRDRGHERAVTMMKARIAAYGSESASYLIMLPSCTF